MREIVLERQPVIPEAVQDLKAGMETHTGGSLAGRSVFHLYSERDGVRDWVIERIGLEMPTEMIVEGAPDAVEYYRELSPPGTIGLKRRVDGLWVWLVEDDEHA